MMWAGGATLAMMFLVLTLQVLVRLRGRRSRGMHLPDIPGPL